MLRHLLLIVAISTIPSAKHLKSSCHGVTTLY